MRLIFALPLAALLVELPANGAEPLELRRAMARAREQAPAAAAARLRQRAADEDVRQARGHRLPTVVLQETWMRTDSPAEAFALELNQERFRFADFVSSDPNDPRALTAAITRLEASLALYTGGEIAGRIAQARLMAAAAAASANWEGDAAALAAARAYVTLAQAREHVELLRRSRDTVARHVELARALVEQGMLVRSELLRAEVERLRLEDLLADAEGEARLAESDLAFRLGDPEGARYALAPLAPAALDQTIGQADWLARADGRADLEAARQALEAGRLEVEVRRAARRPRLGLVLRQDLVDDRPFGDHGDSTSVMATATLDLFAGGRHRAAAAAAMARAEAAAAEVERYARGVRLQVEQAWEEAGVADARRRTAEQAVTAAREAERVVEERFRAGLLKTLDLVDAETARREAETRELVARAELQAAVLRLATAAGQGPEAGLGPASAAQE
jgi:outer membrane protein TolC